MDISTGNFVFLGQAGSGKTTLLKKIATEDYTIVSAIALAAYNCGGNTVHSKFKIPPDDGSIYDLDLYVDSHSFDTTLSKGLIIDEISSMSAKLFCLMDLICKKVLKNNKPFGGLQILMFGDFYQLPPVLKNNTQFRYRGSVQKNGLVFETSLWAELNFEIKHLTENFRQSGDIDFFNCLQECRGGNLSTASLELLFSRVVSISYLKETNVEPIFVFGKNDAVKHINEIEFEKNKNDAVVYKAKGHVSSTHVIPNLLKLKCGVPVMVRQNIRAEGQRISNGTTGIVTELRENNVGVELSNGDRVFIPRVLIPTGIKKSMDQIPLCLAYAFTIHKLQGTTVEGHLCMDLGLGGIFSPCQAYVAASRVRTRHHMFLLDLDPRVFTIDARVLKFLKIDPVKQTFAGWSSFFNAPKNCVPLSYNKYTISADMYFKLDEKSWLLVSLTPLENLECTQLDLTQSNDLSVDACKNRVEKTKGWSIDVDQPHQLEIKTQEQTLHYFYFARKFKIYLLGFTVFLGRCLKLKINKFEN